MGAFDHVVLLLSFIFALALTHLLSRVAALIVERERVKFSGLLALAIVNATLLVYMNWLQMWDARHLARWDLLTVSVLFVFSLTQYFVCAAASIEAPPEGPIDMEAYYWKQYHPFWLLMLLLLFAALASNATLTKVDAAKFIGENLAVLPMFVPVLLALTVKARWAQWTAGLVLLITSVVTAILFSSVLS